MAAKIVTQFNPVLETISGSTGNPIFYGTANMFTQPAQPGTGQVPFIAGRINTQITPGIGGWVYIYNESPVSLTLYLPGGDIVYLPSFTARGFDLVGPKITIDFGVENNPNTYAIIESFNSATNVGNLQIPAAWGAVTVETYEHNDITRPDWTFIALSDPDHNRVQWVQYSASSVNNSTVTIGVATPNHLYLIKSIHITVGHATAVTDGVVTLRNIDNQAGAGGINNVWQLVPNTTSGDKLFLEFDPPLATIMSTACAIIIPQFNASVALYVRFLQQ